MNIPFWKEIGGYLTLVKSHGRWCYVGNTAAASVRLSETAAKLGMTLVRQKRPASLSRAFRLHGGTHKTVIDHFPKWDETF